MFVHDDDDVCHDCVFTTVGFSYHNFVILKVIYLVNVNYLNRVLIKYWK